MTAVNVLDHGYVQLIEAPVNGDLSVVNAMLVSTGKNQETEMTEANKRRINFLLASDPPHASPFEHAQFRFNVKAPIFVAREWFRHRTGSFNEMSGRYKKLEPDFYTPDQFRTQTGKPGHYTFEGWAGNAKVTKASLESHYRDSVELYEWMLGQGIAKEQARIVLPLAMYTEFYFTVNPRNLMNFLRLRNSDKAQGEIAAYAEVMEEMLKESMPITYGSWKENGRRQI